jgi:acyl-coenzyme A synthetase/AMP-(fatty) acid ligase
MSAAPTDTATFFTGPRSPVAFNMADYAIGRAARALPDKEALVVLADVSGRAQTWTFARVEDSVLRIAAALADRGMKRGDRIMIRLENTPEYAFLFFGAIAGGFVPIPASSVLTAAEAQVLIEDSGASMIALAPTLPVERIPSGVIVADDREVAAWVGYHRTAGYSQSQAEDPAYLVYTSGTTARPKGVLHAHRAAWGRRPMYEGWYGIGEDDRVLHAGAFNWTYTLGTGLTDPWATGATAIVYAGDKDPGLWPRLIAASRATIFAAVPSLYRQILKYADVSRAAMPALRHGLIAGEAPPAGLFEAWHEAAGSELYEAFGMSEMSTYLSCAPSVPRRPGYIGKAQPGRAVAIIPQDGEPSPLPAGEEGLIAVHRSDPGLMLGYWQRPDEERQVFRGDWFVGGDLGVMDVDGYIAHRGRANDIMKAMGYRVAPQEVEAVLARVPGVAEVACAEVKVRDDVSVIGAFIVPSGEPPPPIATLEAAAEATLAPYKRPRRYIFLDTLPRTPNGKLKRGALAG